MRKLYSVLFTFIFITSSFAQIPTSGLVGEWKFDNGSLYESGYNSLPVAVAQSGAVPTTDRFGNTDYAYDLQDGSYISFGDAFGLQTTGSNSFSFSYWVKFDQINSTYRYMLGKAGFPTPCGADARQFAFLIDGSNRVEAQLFGALTGGHVRYRSNGTVAANAWTHIVFAVNVQQLLSSNLAGMKIYINGELQTTTVTETVGGGLSANGMDNGTADLSAARYAGPNGVQCGTTQYMDGQFDDLRVYNRLLSQQEVTQLYEHVPCAQTHITLQPESVVSFCSGSSAQLSVELDDPNATLAWQVNTGNGWGYMGVQTGEVTAAGQYRVEVVSPCGAYSYSNITTVVVDAPAFVETPTENPQMVGLCPGETELTLEANAVGEGITYQWMQQINGIWTNIVGADGPTYAATEINTSYNVAIFACGASATTVPYYLVASPTPSVAIVGFSPGTGTICAGNAVTIVSQGSGGTGNTLLWTPGGMTSSNPTVSPSETTTYSITLTNRYGCTASASATVTVNSPEPIISENAGTLSVSGGTYFNVQWYLEGNPISGANNYSYTPTADGDYTVSVTESGCNGTSDPYAYTGVATGISDGVATGLKVYPNPFENGIVMESQAVTTITLTNMLGETLMTRTINSRTEIAANHLPSGIYLLKDETSGAVMKLVKN